MKSDCSREDPAAVAVKELGSATFRKIGKKNNANFEKNREESSPSPSEDQAPATFCIYGDEISLWRLVSVGIL
jgi:hypothetical protein